MTDNERTNLLGSEEAREYARSIFWEMAKLRGWNKDNISREVTDDIFTTMSRHDTIYLAGFRCTTSPAVIAETIQHAEWGGIGGKR